MGSFVTEIKTRTVQKKILTELNRTRGTGLAALSSSEKADIKKYYMQHGFNVGTEYQRLYYSVTGTHDVRFLPDWIMYAGLIEKLNVKRMMAAWADKAYMDLHLPGVNCAETLIRNVNGSLFNSDFQPILFKEVNSILREE